MERSTSAVGVLVAIAATSATDAAGNAATERVKVKLRR